MTTKTYLSGVALTLSMIVGPTLVLALVGVPWEQAYYGSALAVLILAACGFYMNYSEKKEEQKLEEEAKSHSRLWKLYVTPMNTYGEIENQMSQYFFPEDYESAVNIQRISLEEYSRDYSTVTSSIRLMDFTTGVEQVVNRITISDGEVSVDNEPQSPRLAPNWCVEEVYNAIVNDIQTKED